MSLPEYAADRAAVDRHEHELNGGRAVTITDPKAARLIVINLLESNAGAMPEEVAREMVRALRALDFNDVHPILQPSANGRKITYEEQQLQLDAVCFAHFRKASKLMNMFDALCDVAEAYGTSEETVRKWEKKLRDEMGHVVVSRQVDYAKNGGAFVAAERKVRSKAFQLLESDRFYGAAALGRAAAKYRTLTAS